MRITKLHGLGNDFLIVDARAWVRAGASESARAAERFDPRRDVMGLARRLCDRRRGVGADGLLLWTGDAGSPRMTVINADGGEAEMCGNGLRCFAKWLGERHLRGSDRIEIETGAGVLACRLARTAGGEVASVSIAIGAAVFDPAAVPLVAGGPQVGAPFAIGGQTLRLTVLALGNPHAVTFDPLPADAVDRLGPLLTADARFPAGVNAGFATVLPAAATARIALRVHERGCGWTEACGTGATAAVIAGATLGVLPWDAPVAVDLPGGRLTVTSHSGGGATLTGPAVEVFDGDLVLSADP